MSQEFILYDLEYTSWKGALENNWGEIWQHREIVQIAAIKLNPKLEIIDSLGIFVKPSINPILSDYFINLTKIDNEYVSSNGISFIEAYDKFTKFCNDAKCLSFDWDEHPLADGKIFLENTKLNHIDNNNIEFVNIATWIKNKLKESNISVNRINSGRLAKLLNRENNITKYGLNEHNALYDVYSIREALLHFNYQI